LDRAGQGCGGRPQLTLAHGRVPLRVSLRTRVRWSHSDWQQQVRAPRRLSRARSSVPLRATNERSPPSGGLRDSPTSLVGT
jgi:hypothetical protein